MLRSFREALYKAVGISFGCALVFISEELARRQERGAARRDALLDEYHRADARRVG
jgi:hypothetical protein